jgi:major vault protein
MIQGPRQYIPPIEVDIIERRKSIPMDENEGIYIRNNETGEITVIKGETYMLKAHEILYEKELDPLVENLIMRANAGLPYVPGEQSNLFNFPARDKTKLVTFKAAHNTSV